ncbi:MAG: PQQ-dependent sugar dehydrogenase [Bacteroidota bacterium]
MKNTILLAFSFILVLSSSLLGQDKVFTTEDGIRYRVETVLDNLEIPWSIAFDGDGNMYFTERPGRLQLLKKGEKKPLLIASIKEVRHRGEGGLMGLALHPNFKINGFLYVSYTFDFRRGQSNKVVRFRLENGTLNDQKEILQYLPGSSVHNGCRLRFGPDGKLYITTGDAAERSIAQDLGSLGGKILRVNDDGSIPGDNPNPQSPVYAFGFRNPQGIDWHPVSRVLFETEHGPSGFDGPGGGDEVNIVEAGKNYGWPIIHHRETRSGMESPFLEYTPAIAPASGVFYKGTVFPGFNTNYFFGGLRGQRIQRLVVTEQPPHRLIQQEAMLQGVFRRIREVTTGPDGYIYFSTSNRDGRATPFENDDRILRIVPAQ